MGAFRQEIVEEHARGASGRCEPKVLLLHPPGACSAFTRSGSQYPPLGLNQLKAVIGDPLLVDVFEADGYGYSVDETIETLRNAMPVAVGMTVTCGTKPLVHAWSTIVKNLSTSSHHPHPIVIVGGPAAAFESQSIFDECPHVDVVVKGEGEVTFPSIVSIVTDSASQSNDDRLALLSELPGVCVRNMPAMNDGKIPTLPKDAFDTLPFPDLSASPVSKYCAPDALRSPMVTMMTQRGCIAKCAFCNTPQIHGQRIRGWSNERVVEELVRLKRRHGIREVSFVDDVFTNRPGGAARKLCELMIQADLDLT
jgi:anaerobic magnesium-protoporphyrin IX monomethyl ester cyclase